MREKRYREFCNSQSLRFLRIDGDKLIAATKSGVVASLYKPEVDDHIRSEVVKRLESGRKERRNNPIEDEMERRVAAAVKATGRKQIVSYSAYRYDAPAGSSNDPMATLATSDVIVNNLDEVAFAGKIKFVAEPDDFYGGSKSRRYESPVLDSPTWLDLTVLANDMIHRVRDTHHCFFEGFDVTGEEVDGTKVAEFSMGS